MSSARRRPPARGNPSVAETFLWGKLAVFSVMAFMAWRAYKQNGNSLQNPKDGTTVMIDSGRALEATFEVLGFSPSVSPTLSKSAKLALDGYLKRQSIRTGRF